MRGILVALLAVSLLGGCKGTITSTAPLLDAKTASYPFASGAEVVGWNLGDDSVWEKDEHTARVLVVDGAYRIVTPDQPTPSSDSYLLRRIGGSEFVVQANNGSEWAYALIVRADMYYLFTFNRTDRTCLTLSPQERDRFHMTIKDDDCHVASLPDLIGLLRHLRRKFPHPTSAFMVREIAR